MEMTETKRHLEMETNNFMLNTTHIRKEHTFHFDIPLSIVVISLFILNKGNMDNKMTLYVNKM